MGTLARLCWSVLLTGSSEGAWIFAARGVELPPGFVAETLASNLNAATAIAPAPDGRIFIAQQTGELLVWKEGRLLDQPALTLHVADYWERGLIGVTLAADFPRSPYLFVLYVTDRPFVHHVLSRFTIAGDTADPATEVVLLEGDDQAKLGGVQPGGHQGGPLRFGRDGKLFVSIGEHTAGEPAQKLDTLQGKILRLNADGSVPADNPFVSIASGKYRAIYAYGVRNAFGLALQPETGRMFFTDVGGSAFEEVNELIAGANYGWPRAEGYSTRAGFKSPLYAYPPVVGQSICGGTFYPRGSVEALKPAGIDRAAATTGQPFNASPFPARWRGQFFFVDFMKHWIKALDPDAPTNVVSFARGLNGPVAVEVARDGSLLVLNRGAIWRDPKKFVANSGSLLRIRYVGETALVSGRPKLAPATAGVTPALGLPRNCSDLPRKLLRSDWAQRLARERRWPFWMNSRPWHYVVNERAPGLFLPTGGKVKLEEPRRDVVLPAGAVIVRDFSVPGWSSDSEPATQIARLIETRLVVVGSPYSYGASYRWRNNEEAELVEDGELVVIPDVAGNHGSHGTRGKVSVNWWFPGLDDAITFPGSNPSYWVSAAASDFAVPAGSQSDPPLNWLETMRWAGLLSSNLSAATASRLTRGVSWQNSRTPPAERIRSYLHGNCAVCHQPGGASRGLFDARLTTPLPQAGIINGELAAGDLGINGAKVVVPGDPARSILYQRLRRTDFFRMPPVQFHDAPSPILPVLEGWIRSLEPPGDRR